MTGAFHLTCPFCGHTKLILVESHREIFARVACWVSCTRCGAQGPIGKDYASAQDRWDARMAHMKTAIVEVVME